MSSAITVANRHGFYRYTHDGSRYYMSSYCEIIIPYGSKWVYWRSESDNEEGRKPDAV